MEPQPRPTTIPSRTSAAAASAAASFGSITFSVAHAQGDSARLPPAVTPTCIGPSSVRTVEIGRNAGDLDFSSRAGINGAPAASFVQSEKFKGRGGPLQKGVRYFDEALWPHLRAAYNFARWLVRNEHDAEDVVQESFLKAFAAAEEFRGGDPRSWLLAIVRNTAMTFLRRRSSDQTVAWRDEMPEPVATTADPEAEMMTESRRQQIRAAIGSLPEEFREALVLREFEGLSYKEIACIIKAPIGTVMSRLSRARALLMAQLVEERRAGV